MTDLEKYSGLWYEIFKIPFKWEQDCTKTTAEYQFIGEGKLSLKNTCYFEDGDSYSRTGEAIVSKRYTHPNAQSLLFINFNDGGPSDGPSKYVIYWTNYYFSVVGGETKDTLWLLSRTDNITQTDLMVFLKYVSDLGYDISRIRLQKNVKITL